VVLASVISWASVKAPMESIQVLGLRFSTTFFVV